MTQQNYRTRRRGLVTANYLSLLIVNVCFVFVYQQRGASHLIDAAGITAFIFVIATFIPAHVQSGLWKLTHTATGMLDERELQITHNSLSRAYSGFTVICLAIMMVHAVLYGLVPSLDFVISMPLVSSLIYLAHTLPGSILAWTEREVPGELS
ncbi:MAG: hypothetical protein KOO60_06980 [Gemmatimonadales bacterium]|nr:hypothetical protein [Gemmatimonadales bacterium]